jgi:hypothetical protein
MASFRIERVTALPGTLIANTIYLVSVSADVFELYATGNSATARRILNQNDIEALIDAAVAGLSGVSVVADIAERDALVLTANTQVFVIDATADSTVNSGGATYIYRVSNDTFTKISESESLDLVLQWASIQGGPASSPAQIDSAVSNSHTHANKTQLDLVGQSASGDITYNGREYVRSGASDW